jgi:lipid-A-disaccharide synthase
MPKLVKVIETLRGELPGLHVVVPAANEKVKKAIESALAASGVAAEVRLGGARALLREADAAVVASGTATLEAALARCPTVLVYAVSPMLAWFARRVIKGTKHIGLANVIAVRSGIPPPMPELLQEDFTPEAVAERLEGLLSDGDERRSAVAALDLAMSKLESDGSALSIAAKEVLACLG